MTLLFFGTAIALFIGILASDWIVKKDRSLIYQFGQALGEGARRFWGIVVWIVLFGLAACALTLFAWIVF